MKIIGSVAGSVKIFHLRLGCLWKFFKFSDIWTHPPPADNKCQVPYSPIWNWDYRITPHLKLGFWDYTPFEIGILGLQGHDCTGPWLCWHRALRVKFSWHRHSDNPLCFLGVNPLLSTDPNDRPLLIFGLNWTEGVGKILPPLPFGPHKNSSIWKHRTKFDGLKAGPK